MTSADFRAKIFDTTCARAVTNACPAGGLPARADRSGILRSRVLPEPQTIPASASLPALRIASIDHLRIVAAIGIVWFHTEGAPYRQIGYAGLPVFLLIFFSLITRDFGTTTTHFLRRRWNRLLKPWLFWSALYGVCRLARAIHTVDVAELWGMFSIETLFAGTSIHLWYLPYAFVSGLLTFTANRRIREVDHVVAAVTAALVGMLTLAVCTVGMTNHRMLQPLAQWEFGLAAIPLGLAIGRCLMIPSQNLRKTLLAGIALAVLVESQILRVLDVGATATPYGIGTMLVCIAYCLEIKGSDFVLSLAPLTFGIYLIHPLVIYGLQHSLPLTGHYGLFMLLAVCISALITLVLMRTPVRRFL
ncbi:MAG: acyltransferase [Phycisphaerales bacterium]